MKNIAHCLKRGSLSFFLFSISHVQLNYSSIVRKSFYFARHGETVWTFDRLIQGQQEIPLNEIGIKNAENMQIIIKNLLVDYVFYSPLTRVVQTINIACRDLKCLKIPLDDLKEWYGGSLEGTEDVDVINRMKDPAYDGESLDDFKIRTIKAINYILSLPGIPLIVGHGGTYDVLYKTLHLKDWKIEHCAVLYFSPPSNESENWVVTKMSLLP